MSDGDIQLSDSFKLSEFQCKNGIDEILISDILINYLETLKNVLAADSIVINSGYRTPDYSVYVGGGYSDPHTKGIAADIFAYRDGALITGAELCCMAQSVGFGGIGYMGNAIHVDVRNEEEYYNSHWWGDEQTDSNVSDWFAYFNVDRPCGWEKKGNDWFYFEDGNVVKHDFKQSGADWYFLGDEGKMLTNSWVSWKSRWCYVGPKGEAYTNIWEQIDGYWYFFDDDGYTLYSQWIHNESGTWSYVNSDGQAVTGWNELIWNDSKDYYYFNENGTMLVNSWIDDCFVDNTGKMATNCWIGHENEYYWVGADGKWIDKPSWKSIGNPNDGYTIYEY